MLRHQVPDLPNLEGLAFFFYKTYQDGTSFGIENLVSSRLEIVLARLFALASLELILQGILLEQN